MHLSAQDLDDLIDILETVGVVDSLEEARKRLLKLAQTDRWAKANLSRKEQEKVQQEDINAMLARAKFPARWTDGQSIDKPTRLKPQKLEADNAHDLLLQLGLDPGEDDGE